MAPDKLEDNFKDDYNRLQSYAKELRQENSAFDVVTNISIDSLEQGIRKFFENVRILEGFEGWMKKF